jgi:hypothetical protein
MLDAEFAGRERESVWCYIIISVLLQRGLEIVEGSTQQDERITEIVNFLSV